MESGTGINSHRKILLKKAVSGWLVRKFILLFEARIRFWTLSQPPGTLAPSQLAMMDGMAKDTLFLISPGFEDPKQPGVRFVCPHCNQVEGLLASFPEIAASLDIQRVDFQRPRAAVIAEVGENNQSLPLLILGENPPDDAAAYGDRRFVRDTKRILELLADRHGFPRLH